MRRGFFQRTRLRRCQIISTMLNMNNFQKLILFACLLVFTTEGCAPVTKSNQQLPSFRFEKRQAPNCGPSSGGRICPGNGCCSSAGICGSGPTFCAAPDCQYAFGAGCDANQNAPGTSTKDTPRPKLGNVPYGVNLLTCTSPNKVALTFDDGPYLYTSSLLDILESNGVNATFAVTGNNLSKNRIDNPATIYPDIIRRMVASGHHIISHSWSHQDLTTADPTQLLAQIVNNEIALNNILGFFPTYYRPPFGYLNANVIGQLEKFGYHIVNWNLDTEDWKGDYNAAKNNFNTNLSKHTAPSFIVLSHDTHSQTVNELVIYMIQTARTLGYTLTTLGDCLEDPMVNWYRDPITGNSIAPAVLSKIVKAMAPNAVQASKVTTSSSASTVNTAIARIDTATASNVPSSISIDIPNPSPSANPSSRSTSTSTSTSNSSTKTLNAAHRDKMSMIGHSVIAITALRVLL